MPRAAAPPSPAEATRSRGEMGSKRRGAGFLCPPRPLRVLQSGGHMLSPKGASISVGRRHCRRHARGTRAVLQDLWSRNTLKKMMQMMLLRQIWRWRLLCRRYLRWN